MQEITRDMLVGRALELLADGSVSRVMGWKKGDLFYDVTPGVFCDAESLKNDFVYDGFCGLIKILLPGVCSQFSTLKC